MNKRLNFLTPEDLHVSPIWRPIDDLEDPDMEVEPFHGDSLNMEEIYLIASKFILADGSALEGYIRFSWGKPTEMALAVNNQGFLRFGMGRLAETEKGHLEFARELKKKRDDVFPLEYETKIKIHIQGEVY